jgi:hypothetical protein
MLILEWILDINIIIFVFDPFFIFVTSNAQNTKRAIYINNLLFRRIAIEGIMVLPLAFSKLRNRSRIRLNRGNLVAVFLLPDV